MIIPSIDIAGGKTVQLIGGETQALEAGDPQLIMRSFRLVGEVAVVDLDAAKSEGNNAALIRKLLRMGSCRVGGGIRDLESAISWLDAGAKKIVLGTKAVPEILRALPKDRLIAALDAVNGEIVVEGWRTKTNVGILERMQELREYVGGFLVTFVEREGRLGGTNMEIVQDLIAASGGTKLTIAGGVNSCNEIAELDRMGVDAQVGMALYTGRLSLADAFAAPLTSDRSDGLWPTVVCDQSERALGLCYSSLQSLREAIRTGRGVYHSRKRGLWEKGRDSGNIQYLEHVALDCDRDTLRFKVRQVGSGFCHTGTHSCWSAARGLAALEQTLQRRMCSGDKNSYSRRLANDPELLASKLKEEATELSEAIGKDHIRQEAADVLYFTLVSMLSRGVTVEDVEEEVDARALRLTRRGGEAKSKKSS